jgi:hypothetical protein
MGPLENRMKKNKDKVYKKIIKNITLGSFLVGNCSEWIASARAAAPRPMPAEKASSTADLTRG